MKEKDTASILKKRAKKLAAPLQSFEKETDLNLLEFQLGPEKYAVESHYIQEVFPLKEVTFLPRAPRFVHGVINVRRRVISVIDLKVIFDLPPHVPNVKNRAIILEGGAMQWALLADQISEFKSLSSATLQDTLPTLAGIRQEFLKGVTQEGLIVLDGKKLFESKKLQTLG